MAQHLEHRPLHPLKVAGEDAHGNEAHVRHRRIGDQLLHVRLPEGHQRRVDDGDGRQGEDQRREIDRRLREHGQGEAQEAIAPHLQQHAGQDHRPRRRRLHVGVGQPGVHRPHGHLHRERREEGQEEHDLQTWREVELHQGRDRGGARDHGHGQDRRQHQHRAQQGVEEELVGRIDPVLAAPYADDQEHRDQAELEEHVEQDQVQRREHPDHQGLEHQEGDQILHQPGLDARPAGQDADRHQEGGQNHEQDRDPVHAHGVVDHREPGRLLRELETRGPGVEIGQHQQGQGEGRKRGGQGHPQGGAAGGRLPRLSRHGAEQQDGQDADDGREGGEGQDMAQGRPLSAQTPTARRTAVPPRRGAS